MKKQPSSSDSVTRKPLVSLPTLDGISPTRRDWPWMVAIALVVVGLLSVPVLTESITSLSDVREWLELQAANSLWAAIAVLALSYMAVIAYHALRYRPAPLLDEESLPTITVIVPAYNEGRMVRNALISAVESQYPEHKLEVIAVDDGSLDDTWEHIERVADAYPGRVLPVKLLKNSGKREALRAGIERARGEIIVTVDSDSKLDPGAIRAIVAPFADWRVAAVAGKVLVLNRYQSLLTRLLAARFYITFDLVRGAQSRFGAVLCCPGALTAYRRLAVLSVLKDWAQQTFMGSPCTIGEDRALTSWLLRRGHRTVYQSTAVVRTLVPTTFNSVARMLIRWERGNVRESIAMLPTLFTRWRTTDRWWPTFEIITDLFQYPLAYLAMGFLLRNALREPQYLLTILPFVACVALLQSLYCLRAERRSDFVFNIGYSLFAFIGLQWIVPYSCLTIRDGRWLTR
jgi:hyaluronan synthase